MKKYFVLIFLFVLFFSKVFSQQLNQEEKKLYDLIMDYRKSKGLSKIPLSKSLTYVAQTHVNDLMLNRPDQGKCNLHSWSNKGKWSPCCYTDDHAKAECIWSKPRELTNYQGNGYEISSWYSDIISAEKALKIWKSSSGHNALIINNSIWKRHHWRAIGIGIKGNYAVVWFGKESDVN